MARGRGPEAPGDRGAGNPRVEFEDGWLEIVGLRCPGRHGAYAGEQQHERLFLVDVRARLDVRPAVTSDALAAALDFAALAAVVRGVVAGTPRVLLERLAADVGLQVLRDFPAVQAVEVRLEKPEPPGLDAASEAVTVRLRRPRGAPGARLGRARRPGPA